LMVVFAAMVFWLVSRIVTGPAPQLKLTDPPPAKALVRATSVQLAGVPVPTVPAALTWPGEIKDTKSTKAITNPCMASGAFLTWFIICISFGSSPAV
jgi:hypothetical protein